MIILTVLGSIDFSSFRLGCHFLITLICLRRPPSFRPLRLNGWRRRSKGRDGIEFHMDPELAHARRSYIENLTSLRIREGPSPNCGGLPGYTISCGSQGPRLPRARCSCIEHLTNNRIRKGLLPNGGGLPRYTMPCGLQVFDRILDTRTSWYPSVEHPHGRSDRGVYGIYVHAVIPSSADIVHCVVVARLAVNAKKRRADTTGPTAESPSLPQWFVVQ